MGDNKGRYSNTGSGLRGAPPKKSKPPAKDTKGKPEEENKEVDTKPATATSKRKKPSAYAPNWYNSEKNALKKNHRYQVSFPQPKWDEFVAAIDWNTKETNKASWEAGIFDQDKTAMASEAFSVLADEFIAKVRKTWNIEEGEDFPNLGVKLK